MPITVSRFTVVVVAIVGILAFSMLVMSGDMFAKNLTVDTNSTNEITGLLTCSIFIFVIVLLYFALHWEAILTMFTGSTPKKE